MVVASFADEHKPSQSPTSLLDKTPPVLVHALSTAYPLLLFADRVLGWLTWTSNDQYNSVLMVILYVYAYRHLESIVQYWLPCVLVLVFTLIYRESRDPRPPTLDELVRALESSGSKYRIYVAPLSDLRMSSADLSKLVLATLLWSPLYLLVGYYCAPQTVLFALGLVGLTWHSMWFKVVRSVAWRFSAVRAAVFVLTSVDRVQQRPPRSPVVSANETFTFVVYENQRHWIGAGWSANLLAEERAPWTDPSLSAVQSIDSFDLPDADGIGMVWRWTDKDWKLDMTNGGMLESSGKDLVDRADVGESDGFVYTNGFWAHPSSTESFSKYTRRRRWVRKAALNVQIDEIEPSPIKCRKVS